MSVSVHEKLNEFRCEKGNSVMLKNKVRKWANISIIITIAGVIMTAAGIIIDSYDFYWMIAVGLLLSVTFFICFFVFLSQANHLEKMFNNENILAKWSFDQTEQFEKAKDQYIESKKTNKVLLTIITIFFILISGFFVVFGFDSFEDAGGFIGIMSAILLLIYFVALTVPGATYRRMVKAPPLVIVSREAAWIMGEFAKWKAAMTRTDYVELIRDSNKTVIIVHYSIFQRYGYQSHDCIIPVPDYSAAEAENVAAEIARHCSVELRS